MKWSTVRSVSVIAGACEWPIYHQDVKIASLNGVISENVYVHQPPGFIRKGFEYFVCKLNKALYCLRQASSAWYKCIDLYLKGAGWTRCHSDSNLYVLRENCLIVILMLYVDDMYITWNNQLKISKIKSDLMRQYEMSDLGKIQIYLGVEFSWSSQGLLLHQKSNITKVSKDFNMLNRRPSTLPIDVGHYLKEYTNTPFVDTTFYRKLVGQLMFATRSGFDICFAVGQLSQFMTAPHESHLDIGFQTLQLLKYLRPWDIVQTRKFSTIAGIYICHVGSCHDTFKSTGAYIFTLAGGTV